MTNYQIPYRDIEFIVKHLLRFDDVFPASPDNEIDSQFLLEVLTEAGKLGTEVLAPLNVIGDQQGASLTEDGVLATPGFSEAYNLYQEGGWASLSSSEEYGGQNLPNLLSVAVTEIMQSANLAFGLCPLLSSGAIRTIEEHGSRELKKTWLPNMINGRWTGTMNLTESDAGSDLAAIKTRAVPVGDHFLITGQKIFITWGDHQMTDNIVHLVLARVPNAPAGARGLSLFLVPKFLLDDNGQPTQRNDVHCISLEHKLGIHGSPTCTMSYGDNSGAIGYLIGDLNQGLSCMFTMMNHARQSVGVQGLSISERSYQQARQYAKDRLQGTHKDGSRSSIICFPDVRRMLLQMKASIEAMRAFAYIASIEEDKSTDCKDLSSKHSIRTALYTPIVKGWLTEVSQEVTYLGTQIHGGMGFIEETGSAQFYRDARILTIYEGTTGIQALDFVGRKIQLDKGAALKELLADIDECVSQLADEPTMNKLHNHLSQAFISGTSALKKILILGRENPDRLSAVCVPALMLFGYLCGGWVLSASALEARRLLNNGEGDQNFLAAKIDTANFYSDHLLPRVSQYLEIILRESGVSIDFNTEQF